MPHATTTRSPRPSPAAHQRGVALMLVVIALAMATMLAVPFLIAQGTSAAVGQNISDHHRARAIAESGIEMALAYIHQHPDWRDAQMPGVWLAEMPFADGTIHLHVNNDNEDASPDTLDDVVILISTGRYNGTSHTARTRLEGSLPTSLLPYGLSVADRVEMKNTARVDAIDSRYETFHPDIHGSARATVATNATDSSRVRLNNNSTIAGDVLVGPDSTNPENVVTPPSSVTGSISKLEVPLDIPPVTLPANLPSSQGNPNLDGLGQTAFSTGTYRFDDFDIDNDHIIRIQGDVVIVVDENFSISNNAKIVIDPGATLKLYADTLRFENSSTVNYPASNNPAAVQIFQTSSNDIKIKNDTVVVGVIFAPQARLDLSNAANLFGGFQGKQVSLDNEARFTHDLAVTAAGSDSDSSDTGYRIRWLSPLQ